MSAKKDVIKILNLLSTVLLAPCSARPVKRERRPEARGADDDFDPDLQSDTDSNLEFTSRFRRASQKSKRARSPTGDAGDEALPRKRSARVQKRFQSKKAARQEAFAANSNNRCLNLSDKTRNLVYRFCQEEDEITMTHDLLLVDGPFEGYASGRALTQISQQVRAEFLKVYTRTATICLHIEDLPENTNTWLQGPPSPGTVVITFDIRRFEPNSTIGHRGYINVDILPLIKLRQQEPEFQFYFYEKTEDVKISDEGSTEIADSLDRIELDGRRRRLQPVVFRMKLDYAEIMCVDWPGLHAEAPLRLKKLKKGRAGEQVGHTAFAISGCERDVYSGRYWVSFANGQMG